MQWLEDILNMNVSFNAYIFKTIIVVSLLASTFFGSPFGFLGMLLMWFWMKWPKWLKVLITLPFVLFVLLIVIWFYLARGQTSS